MRLSKYTKTPIEYFLSIPIDEFFEWVQLMNAEVKRENKELEKIKAKYRKK